MNFDHSLSHITGTQINYHFICSRKLWLFTHHIECEQESDLVRMGKFIHETSYEREDKELVFGDIKIDFFDVKNGVLHEEKKSDSFEEAHEWQVRYYVWYLRQKGVEVNRAELNYPKLKKIVEVSLAREEMKELEEVILPQIQETLSLPTLPAINVKTSVCKKCSYCELCKA